MKPNRNYSLADIIGMMLAPSVPAANSPAIDVESECVPAKRRFVPTPVKAIFNLKTEEMVPVLDMAGNPVYEEANPGEKSPKKLVKRAQALDKPILASKVFFDDGSWTVVKNSGDDTVDVEEKKLPNGKTVKVATDASKERGLAYAVVKRAFGRVDPATKEVKGANLGRRFQKILAASVDKNASAAEGKAKPSEAKPSQKAKPKAQRRRQDGKETLDTVIKRIADAEKIMTELIKKIDPGQAGEKPDGQAGEAQAGA